MKKTLLTLIAAITLLASHTPLIASPTVGLSYGTTNVKLATATTDALKALEVKLTTLSGSFIYKDRAYFPVTGGALDLANAKGEILHSGGLKFAKGETTVTVSGFIIDTTGTTPVLTGLAAVNGSVVGRIPLFDIGLPSTLTLPLPEKRRFSLSDVTLKLRAEAAGALNTAFSVTAFTAGLDIGTAAVRSHARKL